MQNPLVLIVSTDPLIAALLGTLVELEGYRVAFDDRHESVQAAVQWHRPQLLLVDVDHRDGASGAFLARTRAAGISVVLYGAGRIPEEVRARAEQHGLPWFALPVERPAFTRTLREALAAR